MQYTFWSTFVVMLGITSVVLFFAFQTITNTSEHNFNTLKEVTENAMIDAVDLATYRKSAIIRIDREKFVENFVRRFAETASLSRVYEISIYDVVEMPPKVSLQVSSTDVIRGDFLPSSQTNIYEFNITNRINAILETPY